MNDRETGIRSPILDLLSHVRMALGQLKLYPASSPQAQKVIGPAHAAIAAFPGGQGRITLARTMRGLLVNGKRAPAGDASAMAERSWLQAFQEAQVNSVVILPTISVDELTSFLDAFGRKFWDLKEGKAINARLQEKGVLQAWVEEVEFVAMAKGDLLIEGAAGKLEAAGARVSEIVQTLEQVIDGTATEGLAEQVRLEIVRKLLIQDPLLIQKAKAANFYAEGEGGGGGTSEGTKTGAEAAAKSGGRVGPGGGKLPGWIPFDQARKSLTEIARMLQHADAAEREGLRAIGTVIIGSFRYDPLLRELLKKFLTDECVDLMPAWMTEETPEAAAEAPKGPVDPAHRAADLLALAEEERIEFLAAEAPALLKNLIAAKRTDLAGDLVKALVEHARHVAAMHRLKAVKILHQIFPLLLADGLDAAQAAVKSRVVAALDLERDRAIYPTLVDLAVMAAEGDILRGSADLAIPLLEALRKQQQAEDKDYTERREITARGVEKLAGGPTFSAILEKIRAKQSAAVHAAEVLGAAAARGLVDRMRVSDSMAERLGLAQLVLRAGPEAGNVLAAELQRVMAPSEALKLLDLVRLSMAEAQAEATLGTTLRHPALAVRRRAAAFLRGGDYPRAASYFIEALRSENEASIRVLCVEALGILRHEASLPLLAQILEAKGESDEVRGAAAAALGILSKPQAVPILLRVAVKNRGLSMVFSSAPVAVRAAALRALSGYPYNSEVREALRRSLDDSESAVRSAASESLRAPMVQALGETARKAALVSDPEKLGQYAGDGVAGYLSEVPLDQVCRFLEESGRSGLLSLSVGGSTAQVHLLQGAVIAAEYAGFKGQEAFNRFCSREGLCFLFIPGVTPPEASAPRSLIAMVMDACEIRDPSGPGRA